MIKMGNIITEMSQKQKDAKKDYLFQQSRLRSGNTFPSWTEMWDSLQRNGDSLQRALDDIRDDVIHRGGSDSDFDEKEALEQLEDEQRHRYFEITQEYKHLDGKPCWREIYLPMNVDPRRLPQLGIYWAITETAAEAHWGGHSGKPRRECIYRANIDFDIVDWPGTMFARMDYTLGEDEQEIRFLKNAKIFVEEVKYYDNQKEEWYRFPIKQMRRT